MSKLEYIWIGGNNELRSKVRFTERVNKIEDVRPWNFDGSSTNQATGNDSEVVINPVRLYSDPFDKSNFLVLCDTWIYDKENNLVPHTTNNRVKAEKLFVDLEKYDPMFGMEFEFFIKQKGVPIGYTGNNTPSQGQYYCSVGTGNSFGRDFLDLSSKYCIMSGLNVTGYNLEVAPGQMEIQVCERGLKAADDSIILKYILARIGENNGIEIDWSSKPLTGDWNGSGCHVNFSTKQMREEGGWEHITRAIENLKIKHKEHIKVYGEDNNFRLTGKHETSSIEEFSCGVANRGSSIRIPRETALNQRGYFEDRRPSSSSDMYLVTSKIYNTSIM